MGSAPLLETHALERSFDGLLAVAGVDVRIAEGQLTALIGPNGAGKTSFFNLVSGDLKPDRGTVKFDGRSIGGLAADTIARYGLRRTFQIPRPFSGLSVLENVMLGTSQHEGESLVGAFVRRRRVRFREAELTDAAHEMLHLMGLDSHARHLAGTLSGGQRKLLELARVLMGKPRLVLLDEPISGVSPTLKRELLDHIRSFNLTGETTFFLIEHDLDFVSEISDRIIVMADGRIIADGTPNEVWSKKDVVDAYFGERR